MPEHFSGVWAGSGRSPTKIKRSNLIVKADGPLLLCSNNILKFCSISPTLSNIGGIHISTTSHGNTIISF